MKTTTYICDKCKKSVGKEELIEINVSGILIDVPNGYRNNQLISRDICKSCLREKGLLLEYSKETLENYTKKNIKTLEDKFLEILEDLNVAFQE